MCIIASNITCSRQTRQPRFFSMTLSWNKARNSNTLWRLLKARFCLYLFMKTRLFTVSWQHANVAWWWPNAPSCLERNSEGCMSNDASLAYVWQWPYKYGESLGLTSSWSSSSSSSQYSSSSTSSTSSSSYSYWYWHWCSYSYSIHIHHPHHNLPSALVWRSPSVEEASPTCRTCRNNWYKKMSQCHPVSKNGVIPPKDSEGKAKPKMPHSPGELWATIYWSVSTNSTVPRVNKEDQETVWFSCQDFERAQFSAASHIYTFVNHIIYIYI